MRHPLGTSLLILAWLLLSCQDRNLVAQDPPETNGEVPATETPPASAGESADAQEYARRYDFTSAASIHGLVDAIQRKDTKQFTSISTVLRSNERQSQSPQLNRFIMPFLRQCFASTDAGVRELSKLLAEQPDQTWDWDGLLALNDILEQLSKAGKPEHQALQQQVQEKLKGRFAGFEAAYARSSIGRNELSKRAFSYVRRLRDDQTALEECQRLQKKLDNDFGLISISLERLYLLDTKQPRQWHKKYLAALKHAHQLLSTDFDLRKQFPTAAPKVLSELTRLEGDDRTKLTGCNSVVNACHEATVLIPIHHEMSVAEKRSLLKSVKELRATALLDGYRLCKQLDLRKVDVDSHKTFATTMVSEALAEVAELNRERSRSKFFEAQLSLAGVLFDSLQNSDLEIEAVERVNDREASLLVVLDSLQPVTVGPASSSGPSHQILQSSQDIELSWAEWSMQNRRNLDALSVRPPLSLNELLLTRLEVLRTRAEGDRKSRALTSIGYLHLKYGEYQRAIDVLRELGDEQLFAGQVIRCLACKDQGNIQAAQETLDTINLPDDTDLHKLQKLIVMFLKAELPNKSMTLNQEAIRKLKGELNTEETFFPNDAQPFLLNMLKVNNEHQLALLDLDSAAKSQPNIQVTPLPEQHIEAATKVWTKQLEYTGPNQSFIRGRAAYSLAVLQLTTGSADLRAEKNRVESLIGQYQKALADYEANAVPPAGAFDRLTAQRNEIVAAQSSLNAKETQLIDEKNVRRYCLRALQELPRSGGDIEIKRFEYPSLAFNILCLTLRVYLLAPDNNFVTELSSIGWPLEKISREARRIAVAQRTKIAADEVFGRQRDLLFERYRDAFDLAMELAVENQLQQAAFLGAQTTNQTVADLFQQQVPKTVSHSLLEGKKFISFFVGKHATHVFWRIVDANEIRHHRVAVDRSTLASAVQNYIANYLAPHDNALRSSQAYAAAFNLQEQLFCPALRADLATAAYSEECVYVIPHGPLFQLPLDTLPVTDLGGDAKYLIDTCPPLVYLQSLATFAPTWHGQDEWHTATLLTVQPDFKIGGESQDLLSTFANEPTLHFGPNGQTEGSLSISPTNQPGAQSAVLLNELSRGYRFVHFGAHGAMAMPVPSGQDVKYLDGARLLLRDQEALTAAEVIKHFAPTQAVRMHTELVFLSACESQVSDQASLQYGGNTIQAMGTAFLVAGARNVIASHWKVNDASTKALVTKFMLAVKDRTEKPLTSETYAKLLHRQRQQLATQKQFADPYDWGPFTLSCTLTD